jgi:hypothetical protein
MMEKVQKLSISECIFLVSASSPEDKTLRSRTCACAICRGETGHCRASRRHEKQVSVGELLLRLSFLLFYICSELLIRCVHQILCTKINSYI